MVNTHTHTETESFRSTIAQRPAEIKKLVTQLPREVYFLAQTALLFPKERTHSSITSDAFAADVGITSDVTPDGSTVVIALNHCIKITALSEDGMSATWSVRTPTKPTLLCPDTAEAVGENLITLTLVAA